MLTAGTIYFKQPNVRLRDGDRAAGAKALRIMRWQWPGSEQILNLQTEESNAERPEYKRSEYQTLQCLFRRELGHGQRLQEPD